MSNLRVFTYNDHEITFDFSNEQKMINATQMAATFNKLTKDFLKLKSGYPSKVGQFSKPYKSVGLKYF